MLYQMLVVQLAVTVMKTNTESSELVCVIG